MAMKFPWKFVSWIMECVTTASFSLVLNGEALPSFEGMRGLRQGDPISPLLFVLVMDYFSRIMKRVATDPAFRFHPGCKSLCLNNLMFADNILVFCKGQEASVQMITRALHEFEGVSGLAANPAKSRIHIGGCRGDRITSLCRLTGFNLGEFPMRYLGFPLSPRKWNKAECWRLIKQITKRIHCWTSRHLSYAWRTVLVNYVLMTLHVY